MRSFLIATLSLAALAGATGAARAETAIFAGGCFWCVESDMDHVKGVTSTISGYAGGTIESPTYQNHEGYTEAVKVEFDPKIVSYETVVNHFLRTIDVTDAGGQFCDRGPSYVTAIFTMGKEQQAAAEQAVKLAEKQLGQKVVTPVKPYTTFTDAEEYHQNYYLGNNRVLTRFGYVKQSDAYKGYREGCGRDARVKEVWGDAAYSYPKVAGSGS
jgi:peptide-methionine (S)-S-oxide reductase